MGHRRGLSSTGLAVASSAAAAVSAEAVALDPDTRTCDADGEAIAGGIGTCARWGGRKASAAVKTPSAAAAANRHGEMNGVCLVLMAELHVNGMRLDTLSLPSPSSETENLLGHRQLCWDVGMSIARLSFFWSRLSDLVNVTSCLLFVFKY